MSRRNLLTFIQNTPLDNSLLLGFYGGGNYGDELLMEVLAGLLQKQGSRGVHIAYQTPLLYDKFHHNFGFKRIPMRSKGAMIKALLRKKRIVVGGGGLWGMDANANILFMSIMLFICRMLGKKVYLLEVGYYDSAPRLGRISAWFAAKAANAILARDEESFQNFKRLQSQTQLDSDIAWYIDNLDLSSYQVDVEQLEKKLDIHERTLFITLRRFRAGQGDHLKELVNDCLRMNTEKNIIIALMEPRHVDPGGYRQLRSWQREFDNVQILDYGCNPLALFLLFRRHHDQLIFVGPQFHGILSAHINGMPYLPLAYDNKVHNLLQEIAPEQTPIPLNTLQPTDLQQFIDDTYMRAVQSNVFPTQQLFARKAE